MTHKNSFLKRLKQRIRPRWIRTLRQLLQSRRRLVRVTRRMGLGPMPANPLAPHKQSDTLFILGSGSSINRLSDAEWGRIKQADSLGFNFWPIHDHIPTLYVVEICAVPTGLEANYQAYRDLMQVRAQDYAQVPILIKDGERVNPAWLEEYISHFPDSLRPNMALSWDWEIPDEEDAHLATTLQRWQRWGLLESGHSPLLRKRASVFYLVLLGLRAGYKEIVLCGVDLDNNDYFYREKEADFVAKGRPVPPPVKAAAGAVIHKTDNVQMGSMTISSALAVLNREILQPKGVRLSVGLQSSKLYPMLPAYFGH